MWTATIDRTDFSNGQFRVFVKYSDGINSFEESYNLSTRQALNSQIKNRLEQLTSVQALASSIEVGSFTPEEEVVVGPTPYELAVGEVARLKGLISLGIMKETDPEFVNAVTELKVAYGNLQK